MKLASCATALALAIVICGPAQAQNATTTVPKGTPNSERMEGRNFENDFNVETLFHDPEKAAAAYENALIGARCVVKLSGERGANLLGGPYTKDTNYRVLAKAMGRRYRGCGRDAGAVLPLMMSNAIAEQLMLGQTDRQFEDRAMSVDVDKAAAFHGDFDKGPLTFDTIARCAAVYSPGLVFHVLQADPGSSAESTALNALYQQTPECGIAQQPTSIPPAFQRGALAAALYHWTHRSS